MNTHQETALAQRLDVNRVVEVLGVAPVHGKDVAVTQIQATRIVGRRQLERHPFGLTLHLNRKFVAQVVFENHRLGLGLGVVRIA